MTLALNFRLLPNDGVVRDLSMDFFETQCCHALHLVRNTIFNFEYFFSFLNDSRLLKLLL